MDVFKNLGHSIKSGWHSLTRLKKVALASILSLVVIIGLVVTFFTQKTTYALLFSEIEEADSGAIVSDLEAQAIAYRLEDNGTTIYIDEKFVDTYRIGLAVNDMLPSESIGFEIFDNTSMMATDEDRKIMHQRAVQGELERAIGALSGVESVKVLLSFPEKSVFTRPEDMEKATASVILQTTGGKDLSTTAIQGIASLVSGAVDDLPMENVSIVDQGGKLLSAFIQSESSIHTADLASQNRQMEQKYASELERKLLQTLAPVYGVENLSISVNVKMDFEVAEEEKTEYGESFVRSQDITASGGDIVADEGGALSGNDVAINEILEGENGSAASYSGTTNNELNTTTTRRIYETGEINAISASILYNTGIAGLDERDLEAIARGVIGATAEDTIEVQPANFVAAETPVTEDLGPSDAPFKAIWDQYGMMLVAGAGILLFILIWAVVASASRRRKYAEEIVAEEMSVNTSENTPTEVKNEKESLQQLIQSEKRQKEENAHKQAKENPELAADLIKMWMKDE